MFDINNNRLDKYVNNYVNSVYKILAMLLCVSEICKGALEEENTLAVNIAAETNTDIQSWNNFSPDDVRCYCNLPLCVTTGYMCKSEVGICFSEIVDPDFKITSQQDVYSGRHGCIELLEDKNQRSQCRNMPNGKSSSKVNVKSLLLCCSKDMCNHVDNPETQTILNGTHFGGLLHDNPSQSSISQSEPPGYTSNDVWFKAAIIAVPICGTVILTVLIVLAVKILRTDTLHASSKLGDHYSQRMDRESNRDHFEHVHHQSSMNMKKVPLLTHHHHHDIMSSACTNHSSDEIIKHHPTIPLLLQNETGVSHSYEKKNEANAKLNYAQGHEYNLIQNKDIINPAPTITSVLQKPMNTKTASNNIYKNVNLSIAPTEDNALHHDIMTDKLYDKQALSSVVNWGSTNGSCPV